MNTTSEEYELTSQRLGYLIVIIWIVSKHSKTASKSRIRLSPNSDAYSINRQW